MDHRTVYTHELIARLELGWGEGWLSPGGEEEVAALVAGCDLAGKHVLDIGAGAGGPAMLLTGSYGAARVTGIDVEEQVLRRARALIEARGLHDRIEMCLVEPGPLPFADGVFDVVFSKDAFIHIADKADLFREVFRVLRPGGLCLFSDWCCGEPPYSEEMHAFLDNGMGFCMATIEEMRRHLDGAGFRDVVSRDRNGWFAQYASQEYRATKGPRRARLVCEMGHEGADGATAAAKRRATVAGQGHLRPAHFRAVKPAEQGPEPD